MRKFHSTVCLENTTRQERTFGVGVLIGGQNVPNKAVRWPLMNAGCCRRPLIDVIVVAKGKFLNHLTYISSI